MKFNALRALAAFSLLGLTSTAFAGYDIGPKQANFYVGLGAGETSGFATSTLGGVAVIGWQPHPAFALELGAEYLGTVALKSATPGSSSGKAQAESLSALIYCADFVDGLNAYLRVGVADTKLPSASGAKDSADSPLLGVGLQYQYYHTMFVRAQVDRFSNFGASGVSPLNATVLIGMRF
jgi:hypothetical protein